MDEWMWERDLFEPPLPEQNQNWYKKPVSNVKTGNGAQISLKTSVKDAIATLKQSGVRELPAVSDSGVLTGLFRIGFRIRKL